MTTTAKLIPCPKCDGSGRIDAFGHYDNGRCFCCGGTGNVGTDNRVAAEVLDSRVGELCYTAAIVLEAADRGDESRAAFYLNLMVDRMFTIGTERARLVLRYIADGNFWDADENAFIQCAPGVGPRVAAQLVALGRKRKAAA